ncbi:MAG: proline--tRNA ligase [Deltaproteobacteria bacterium]|nr:proline--tRNA ligase [Deltaproteobacteria bacterium]
MRASRLHIVTYREDPADAEVLSHRLMARAGLIFKVSSGLYAYSPMLWKSLKKAQGIVRDELDHAGCLEIQAPILQDRQLWEQSGRWDVYEASGTMFTSTDRRGTTYGLAPTAEEVVTAYARATVKSYKQLPICLYQIHTKFRDEIRPRFGLLRVKEFLMKDAYSFDVSDKALADSYENMRLAYHRIFRRMGLEAFGVDADPGDIGGSGSMEFMLAADSGEDAILIEESSGYAANVEKATSRAAKPAGQDEAPRDMRVEDTPGVRTCDELSAFFPNVPPARMVKTVLFKAIHTDHEEFWAALIRGDQEINEVKLRNHTSGLELKMLSDDEIEAKTGAKQGFAGPIGLSDTFQIVADKTVRGMVNLLCGLNTTDQHALDVNIGRDFPEPTYADFRLAREGEPGPTDGDPLILKRGIEVGHIFQLGTKYSAAMGATFMAENGREQPLVMGCYGIGVSRVVAAAIEQNADEHGVVWPVPLAPFEVAVACLSPKDEELSQVAEDIYTQLGSQGVDVMLDDRKLSPGAKLKDLELLGFPFTVIVGRAFRDEGKVEVRNRREMSSELVAPELVTQQLTTILEDLRVGLSDS